MDMESLDNWTPTPKTEAKIIRSQWRQAQNRNTDTQQPNNDDVKKIKAYLKKNFTDADIMNTFGITADILLAIKKDNYTPTEGIGFDTEAKILSKFKLLDRKITQIHEALDHITIILGFTDKDNKAFNKILGKHIKIEEEECEDLI